MKALAARFMLRYGATRGLVSPMILVDFALLDSLPPVVGHRTCAAAIESAPASSSSNFSFKLFDMLQSSPQWHVEFIAAVNVTFPCNITSPQVTGVLSACPS